MARDQQQAGNCGQCGTGTVRCSYNFFAGDDLQIHTWEHRCLDCSVRETTAYRSDEEPGGQSLDPICCPYCSRTVSTD
ncbi:MAG: hypothetical protein VB875_11295 [Pirellulales bacterium]